MRPYPIPLGDKKLNYKTIRTFLLTSLLQVFNGCLLPFFSICLLICLNDHQFMKGTPQKGWSNVFLFTAVIIILFLTANTMTQNLFGWLVTNAHTTEATFEAVKFSLSGVIAVGTMFLLCLFTSLGKNIWKSLTCCRSISANDTNTGA